MKGPFALEGIGPGTQESRVGITIKSIGFLDNERLAVTVVTQTRSKPGLPRRGEPSNQSAFRLDAVLIDPLSGKVVGMPVWPSNSRYAGIVAINDRGFVIQRGDQLDLLSTSLAPVSRLELPELPADEYAHDRYWTPRSSWSGRRLLLLGWRAWKTGPWLWVDAMNLEILKSWEGVGTGPVAASDSCLVMSTGARHFGDAPSMLEIEMPGGRWNPIPATLNPANPQFVGRDVLYFHRYRSIAPPAQSAVFLMHLDVGAMDRLDPARNGWELGQAAASRAGNRFVILVGQTKGSHRAFDVSGHGVLRALLVFDTPFVRPSFTLDVQDSHIKNPDLVALSPDGRHLAVFGYPNPVLEVFQLPPPT